MMQIDKQKCIRCGLCEKVCPKVLLFGTYENGLPDDSVCFRCGQCRAVCPTGALGTDADGAESMDALRLTPEMELQSQQSRHSVRAFRREQPEESTLQQILMAGACAPSAGNRHPVSVIAVKDAAHMDWLRARAGRLLHERAELWSDSADAQLRGRSRYFARICGERPEGAAEDRILFQAPVLLLAVAEPQYLCDAAMTMAAMERMAYACGLGGVYCGFFTNAVKGDETVHSYLEIDRNEEILLSFALGKPKYAYRTIVPREPLKVTWF